MAIKLVTFDVYMALIDIQGSLAPVVAAALDMDAEEADGFVRLWRAKQMERAAASNSLNRGRTTFRDCTRIGLDYVLARRGIGFDDRRRRADRGGHRLCRRGQPGDQPGRSGL